MQKLLLTTITLATLYSVTSCLDPSVYSEQGNPTGQARNGKSRSCATMDVLNRNLAEDPTLAKKIKDIDEHAKKMAGNERKPGGGGGSVPYEGTVIIPVVVHVIYNTNNPQENISQAQIQSQIDVLNRDFSATNPDANQTPGVFAPLVSNLQVQFALASVDRTASSVVEWGTNDAMKNPRKGGVAAVDPSRNLNIWVCNIGGGILGYAQFPGGKAATDGVVVGPQYFGNTGYLEAPFDGGRTTTHEVGHWLNLRHIWGDGGCGIDDQVTDTPDSDQPTFGCPSFPTVRCSNTLMTMNYMDYTDDACMYMFSTGQRTRARALFASDGVRRSFVTATP